MSENIRNHEADDVLASVRRIVARSMDDGRDTASTRQTTLEKLLLTPSLRVEGEADAPQHARTRVTTRTLSSERTTLEQRIAELERTISPDGNWEPDGSEEPEQETPRHFPIPGIRDRHMSAPPLDLATFRSERSAPADTVAEDYDDEDAGERELPARLHLADADPEIGRPITEDENHPIDEPAMALEQEPTAADALSRVDEETLRRIVAEIVRAELQGELGERITRNVRKLVRREIYRAIMAREFTG